MAAGGKEHFFNRLSTIAFSTVVADVVWSLDLNMEVNLLQQPQFFALAIVLIKMPSANLI